MRKDIFYRCSLDSDRKVTAVKTTGYSEGDIGVHKEEGFWVATHIPTGLLLTPKTSRNKTMKQAWNEASERINSHENFAKLVEKALKSKEHQSFSDSRYAQSVTKVF